MVPFFIQVNGSLLMVLKAEMKKYIIHCYYHSYGIFSFFPAIFVKQEEFQVSAFSISTIETISGESKR